MPRDIVLIPTFYRPEYLWLCLEKIHQATWGQEKEIWISHDRHLIDSQMTGRSVGDLGADLRMMAEVINYWKPKFKGLLRYSERQPHSYVGNGFNFLELYKEAYLQIDARYIYLIEDDVHIADDFFRWHEAVQERGNYFCTIGWHCMRNETVRKSSDPNGIVESGVDYTSIGVCWKREKLGAVVWHACEGYYKEVNYYLQKKFPHSPIPWGQWGEQAGLILRLVLDQGDRVTAWPVVRRCSHFGLHGPHRTAGRRFTGPLINRVAELRRAIDNGNINRFAKDPFDDIDEPLVVPDWKPEDLQVVQRV